MTHIKVRKLLETRTNFAGRTWSYEFRSIPKHCMEATVTKTCQQLLSRFAPISKSWDDDKNSEWIARIYFAAKMVLASSVMAQSLEFAKTKNLRAVVSYLDYYTVLNSLRSILLTNPSIPWDNGGLLLTTHTKTINIASDIFAQFNRKLAGKTKQHITHLKAYRELISYRAPSSGDSFPKADIDVIDMCRLFAEIAQLQSELIETSFLKNASGKFFLKADVIDQICDVEIDGFTFYDKEDHYRMDYLRRKHPLPTNIMHIMSEGHVEDFFGSWRSKDEEAGEFDPDADWGILFDVP
ncbi:MAG: hypothetical protein HYV14_13335 [Elusimicrobia bacterium]|nr:hypothetical protein [Elusimicrobiota bacterium]